MNCTVCKQLHKSIQNNLMRDGVTFLGIFWYFFGYSFLVMLVELALASGCRTGPPSYAAWWAGKTTRSQSQLQGLRIRLQVETNTSNRLASSVVRASDS
jgi:hypothetical protein